MATKLSIRPLHDRVIIERIEETRTAGGIVIPETAGEKPMKGIVRAIGPGKHVDGRIMPLDLKVGDRILFGKYAGTEVKMDGKEYLVMREEDIMGVITD